MSLRCDCPWSRALFLYIFKVEHKDDKPGNNFFDTDIKDVQIIRREDFFIADDRAFTRCRGKFHVHLDDKIEFVSLHDIALLLFR